VSDIVADAKAWLSDRDSSTLRTHSENCHQWHAECLVARLVAELERSARDEKGLAVTCPASRHAEQIADELIEHGSCGQLDGEGKHAGRSILSAVRSLYAARAEIARLTAEVKRHRMTEEERALVADAAGHGDYCHWAMAIRGYLARTAPPAAS